MNSGEMRWILSVRLMWRASGRSRIDRILNLSGGTNFHRRWKGKSFLDYFPGKDTILFLDEPVRLVERGQNIEDEFHGSTEKRLESGYDLEEEEAKIFPVTEILKKINCYSSIGFYALEMKCKGLEVRESYEIQAKSVNPYNNSFEMLTQDLKRLKRNGYRVFCCQVPEPVRSVWRKI